MNLQLSIAMTVNPRTRPILDGSVKADGIDLIPTPLHPSEMFWRQLKFADFDVSELSFSSLSMAKARGDERFVGLPIFTTRHFFQNWILVRKGARIESPADMKGKRVGVPEYQQTAAVWSRGILEHDFGVAPKDMEFWMERAPAQSHGGSTGFKPPPGVTVLPVEADLVGVGGDQQDAFQGRGRLFQAVLLDHLLGPLHRDFDVVGIGQHVLVPDLQRCDPQVAEHGPPNRLLVLDHLPGLDHGVARIFWFGPVFAFLLLAPDA